MEHHAAVLAKAVMWLFRQLIRWYPSDVRDRYGAGMERMLREKLEEACSSRTIGAVSILVAREAWSILRTVAAQRIAKLRAPENHATVGNSAGPPSTELRQAWRPMGRHRLASPATTVNAMLGDVRYAVRSCIKRPSFALTVIAQLGLGIGATTVIVSVVDNVLVRGLPYPNAQELVVFGNPGHSLPLYIDWRDRTNSFSAVAATWSDGRGLGISGDGVPESIPGAWVTAEFFQMFGARAIRGRLLTVDDCAGTPPRVAVVSHRLWQRRWGGSWSSPLTITVDGNRIEVVGVLDPAFQIPEALVDNRAEVWLPIDLASETLQRRTMNMLSVVARRTPGVSTAIAQQDVHTLAVALAEEHPSTDRLRDGSPRLYPLIPLLDAMVGDVDSLLYMLLAAAGMMLLISCANVANLFLARETTRTREVALRTALGAGRGRIVAQLLTESVLLALASGTLGLVLAFAGVSAFEMYNPGGIPRVGDIAIDARVLCMALVVSLASGVLFGLVPAITCSRPSVSSVLRTAEAGVTNAGKPLMMRKVLVVAEVATGLMLLVGAGLLIHSFVRLRSADGGFEPENVFAMPLNLGDRFSEEQRLQFTHDLLDRIDAIPGVEQVGAGSTLPPYRQGRCCWFGNVQADEEGGDPSFAMLHPITPGYFGVLGATIVRGRGFTAADSEAGWTPTVVNETLVHRLFGDADPLGKSILAAGARWKVVGVVNDIRHWGLQRESGANAYVPHALLGGAFTSLQVAVKSQLDPAILSAALRDAVWAIDGDLPIREITRLDYNVARSLAQPRFVSILFTAFATLAILLTAGGIYCFMTYFVRQRRRELGIRVALGASKSDLVRTIVRSVLFLTLIGSVLGLAGAFALSRLLGSLLYGVTATDPSTFAAAALLLNITALAACYLPVHQASHTDPVETLRVE